MTKKEYQKLANKQYEYKKLQSQIDDLNHVAIQARGCSYISIANINGWCSEDSSFIQVPDSIKQEVSDFIIELAHKKIMDLEKEQGKL
jgi:hypothetical protein